MWEYYRETLPEAGASDGLRRMYRTGAEGNLRAKTGTIDHVSALSGYVTAANGERLAFSIISNNVPSTWMAKRVEDAIGARLAQFERPLDAAPVTPPATERPPSPAAAPEPETAPPATPSTSSPARTHTIRSGETLSHLARQYSVSVAEIERANPGLDARRIRVGQTIRIPGNGATDTTATRTPSATPVPAATA
jgi:LysM repeat protein